MLKTHESRQCWLMTHNRVDEYIIAMKNFSSKRGEEINVDYAEGYRQHLGQSYPQNNILKEVLTEYTQTS